MSDQTDQSLGDQTDGRTRSDSNSSAGLTPRKLYSLWRRTLRTDCPAFNDHGESNGRSGHRVTGPSGHSCFMFSILSFLLQPMGS